MSTPLHILSTRRLSPAARTRFERPGWRLTVHDFIQKKLALPAVHRETIGTDVVLTSQLAARAFAVLARKICLPVADCRVHCLAHATQRAATRAGLAVATTAPNARLLALEILKAPHIRAVTHVCGNRRRHELSHILTAAGIAVTDLVAYHTTLTALKLDTPPDAILFFSPSAIDSFCTANEVKQIPCFCIGQTTAHHAGQRGFCPVFSPASATEAALTELAIATITQTRQDD